MLSSIRRLFRSTKSSIAIKTTQTGFPKYERREDLLSTASSSSKEYVERISALDKTIHECVAVSNRYTGVQSETSAHYYASVLFSVLCGKAISFAFVAPRSSFAERKVDHWDYSTLAVLARNVLEVRIAFFYLGSEVVPQEEWYCRWNVANLHGSDCCRLGNSKETVDEFNRQADILRDRLRSNNHFSSLPEKEQKRLLHGKSAYMIPLEDISDKAGVDRESFRWLYKFLSSHVHAYPMSYYRMSDDSDRGRGVHCETEETYSKLCVTIMLNILVHSRDDMHRLFAKEEVLSSSVGIDV